MPSRIPYPNNNKTLHVERTEDSITGIFGGSFNPIHNGHISLAHQILTLAGLDEIWFMVSPQNPLKQTGSLLCDHKRMQMVESALSDEPHLKACDYELNLPKPSYTYLTMRAMANDFPDRKFALIIGADNWQRFNLWRNYDELLNNYPIIIYPRTGFHIDSSSLPPTVRLVNTDLINISSTEIRERISKGENIDDMVPGKVHEIIAEEKLYSGINRFI